MTAPTPERRVGEERPRVEAERVAHLAGMSDETVAGNFPAGGTMRALSRDLLDARTALIEVSGALHTEHQRVLSHAAEVERWKADAKQADRERGEALAEYERMMAERNLATADLESATAEVERLRGVMEAVATSTGELLFYHEQHLVSEAADRFRLRVLGPLRTALSLPTPGANGAPPEATEEERNFAARQPFLGCRKDTREGTDAS